MMKLFTMITTKRIPKKYVVIFIVVSVLATIFVIDQLLYSFGNAVIYCYRYDEDKTVKFMLTDEETQIIRDAFQNKTSSSANTCSYSTKVSIRIGLRCYMLARDGCQGLETLHFKFYDIPIEDMDRIHGIFEKYGQRFPCV